MEIQTKTCTKCHKSLSLDLFNWKSKRRGLKSPNCKSCQKEMAAQHYKNNKQKYIDRAIKQKQANRDWFLEYKSSLACVWCGENNVACLDFHHPSDNKENDVSALVRDGCIDKAKKEIEKCIVLCSNCHRKLHFSEKNSKRIQVG